MSDVQLVLGGTQRIYATLSPADYKDIKQKLTFVNPQYTRAKSAGEDTTNIKQFIYLWRELDGFLHVPRYYTHPALEGLTRARVAPKAGDFKLNMVTSPREAQLPIIEEMLKHKGDFGLCLPCGVGKTFLALYAATQSPGRILVVVPTQVKLNEWMAEIERHTDVKAQGLTIGHVQASVRRWEGSPITVTVINTLAMQAFPKEFLNGFASVIWDEAHLDTAPVLSQALGRVNGRQISLTATPGGDLRRAVLELHNGRNWVEAHIEGAKTTAVFATVPISDYHRKLEWKTQKLVLSRNAEYTNYAARLVKQAIAKGRRVMVLNAFKQPLHRLFLQCGGGFVMGVQGLIDLATADARIDAALTSVTPLGASARTRAENYIEYSKKLANPVLGIGLTKKQPAGVGMDVSNLDGGVIMFPVPDPDMTQQLVGRWNRLHPDKKPPVVVVMVPDSPIAHRFAEKMAAKMQSLDVDVKFTRLSQ